MHVEDSNMINQQFLNSFISVPDLSGIFIKDYFESIDECIQKSFNKFYAAEVFGSGSEKYLMELTNYMNIFHALLLFKDEYDINSANNDVKTKEYYLNKFSLGCVGTENKLMCSGCNDAFIDSFMEAYGGEFSDDFSDDFLI